MATNPMGMGGVVGQQQQQMGGHPTPGMGMKPMGNPSQLQQVVRQVRRVCV
jgi:hypothetical protein